MASETPENSGSLADRITNPDAQPGTIFDKLPSFRVNNPSLLPAPRHRLSPDKWNSDVIQVIRLANAPFSFCLI